MPFTALLYKEFRQQAAIGITLFVCTVLLQTFTTVGFVISGMDLMPTDRAIQLVALSWVIVTIYAYGSAGSIFAREHEEKTYNFLRCLPIRRRTLLAAKLTWVLLGTLAFALCLAVETYAFSLCTTFPYSWELQKVVSPWDVQNGVEYFNSYSTAIVFCNTIAAAVVWGLFWSVRSRYQLFALLATFVCAAATGALCKHFFGGTDYELAALIGVECIVLSLAIYRAYFWFDRWVDRKQCSQEPGASAPGCVVQEKTIRGLTPPALALTPWRFSFIALTWHAVRQSGWLFAFAIVVGVFCIVWRYFAGRDDGEIGIWGTILALFTICVFCGLIFTADYRYNTVAMLGHRGVKPGKVWWSRITAFGSVYFLFVIVYYAAFVRNTIIDGFLMPTIFIIPFCCGALISLLFRSPILAPCLTAAAWIFFLFWTEIFMWAADVYTGESRNATIYWSTFPLLIGFLMASRLRIGDWLRERSLWRSRRPVVCLMAGPALLFLAAIPLIRIYSVPVVNYGYSIDQWELKRQLEIDNTGSVWSSFHYDWRPIVSLEDFKSRVNDYRQRRQSAQSRYGINFDEDRIILQIVSDTLARYEGEGEQRKYIVQRKGFVTAEFAAEAIAFLESMENDRTPSVEQVRAVYENYVRLMEIIVKRPKVFEGDEFYVTVSRYYRWLPWERIRTERLLWNDFQIQSRFAEQTDRAVFENEGDFESLLYSYSEEYLKNRRDLWGIDGPFDVGIVAPQKVYEAEVARRALILRFALLQYGLEKNRLPGTLDELVASGILKELPTVPVFGGPFGYDKDDALLYGGIFELAPFQYRVAPNHIAALRRALWVTFSVERFPK